MACVAGKDAPDTDDTDGGGYISGPCNGLDAADYVGMAPADAEFFAVLVSRGTAGVSNDPDLLYVVESVGRDRHPVFWSGDCPIAETVSAYYR